MKQRTIGLIPARAGSVRIPKKNMQMLGTMPLIEWSIWAACDSNCMDAIYVSTNDPDVKALAEGFVHYGVEVINRPDHLSRGEDGSMLNTVRNAIAANESATALILLQPTSPFRTADQIDAAYERWINQVVKLPVVSVDQRGKVNGAIYIMSMDDIRNGKPIYEDGSFIAFGMGAVSSMDIDTEDDLARARHIADHQLI